MPPELPSFDLVVATVGRVEELERFLDSLEAQEYPRVRVLVVDQNEDAQLEPVLAGRGTEILHLRSRLGLSRARNVALEHVAADVVAFPDDDCVYPPDLLARVGARLAHETSLDGVSGKVADIDGRSSASWKIDVALLTDDNLWNRVNSGAVFLRRELVESVGAFDERLGLGSAESWSSGEEIDYLIRAVRAGARIEYDPSLVVRHAVRIDDSHIGLRDGASVGYLLRKHGYPARTVARMLMRPVGGAAASLAHRDRSRASYCAATVRGRIRGYFGASSSKISW